MCQIVRRRKESERKLSLTWGRIKKKKKKKERAKTILWDKEKRKKREKEERKGKGGKTNRGEPYVRGRGKREDFPAFRW